ncbi:MAG: heavy metal translocating P-type ATPase [bacterium]|nr:heavy metal translocating P-type ATPase [bacterium]
MVRYRTRELPTNWAMMLPTTNDKSWPTDWPPNWLAAAESGRCLHCGNNLGNFWKTEDGPFCCRGCRSVWEMINRKELSRFYDLRIGTHVPAASLRSHNFDWLDQLLAKIEKTDEPLHLDLDIQGVHCAACVWLIEQLFRRREAGIQIRINSALGKAELSWDRTRGDLKDFLIEVEKFGYRFAPDQGEMPQHSRTLLMRMAVSIAMALNVMMFSLSYYFGLTSTDGALYPFFGWLSLGLATIAMVAGGGVFFTAAVAGLRRRVLHLDLPISVGMALAYGGSVYGFLSSGPESAYFDSLTVFIALMLIGRWAQEHILERNRNSLLTTTGAEHLTVKRQVAGAVTVIAAPKVESGDELWIAPGDLVVVEGILLRRRVEVSLDWITGESEHVALSPGDKVPAGAFNAGSHGFAITATEDFADGRLRNLLLATTDGEDFQPRWWHRISGWYVSLVLLIAGAGLVGWMAFAPSVALQVAISVLVVTCPCALGLAPPLATELIHVGLRRAGIFLRKSDFLEKALQVRKILLDKTGTVTMGQLTLSGDARETLRRLSAEQRAVLGYMTSRSNHPVSLSLSKALQYSGSESTQPLDHLAGELRESAGCGLELNLAAATWRLGRASWALSTADAEPDAQSSSGDTVLSLNGELIAGFHLTEEFKADAAAEVHTLQRAGYDVYMVSGDHQAKVDLAATALGIPEERAWGGLDPEAKVERIKQLDDCDTLMVGDGLNDSPGFAAALCAATPAVDRPVLPGKSDFCFLGDGIVALRRSLLAARLLRKVVRGNLIFAVAYNVLAVGLCLAGLVTPVVAAILMPVSSVFVVSWTFLRLTRGVATWTS